MLLISDDPKMENLIPRSLSGAERTIDLIGTCEFSSDDDFARTYEVALLDLEFPLALGNVFLRQLRGRNSSLSTIVLARKKAKQIDFSRLEIEGQTYVAFSKGQALTCLRTILGRASQRPNATLTNGSLKLNTRTREASFLSERALLSPLEAELLEVLLASPGQVVRRIDLERRLLEACGEDGSLESVMQAIRGKLGMLSIKRIADFGWMVVAPHIEWAIEVGFFDERHKSGTGNILFFPGCAG